MQHLLHILGQIVNLRTVLIRDNGSLCGTRISAQNDTILEDNASNGGAGLYSFRWLKTG